MRRLRLCPYHIRATLDEAGNIDAASCTCPYDWGGDCKHIVALLLTYLHEPESFEARAPVQDTLSARSKEDLIALIRQMVGQYPDLPVGKSFKKIRVERMSTDSARYLHLIRQDCPLPPGTHIVDTRLAQA